MREVCYYYHYYYYYSQATIVRKATATIGHDDDQLYSGVSEIAILQIPECTKP